MLITLDNGGLNRFRPENQVRNEMTRFLKGRPYEEHFCEINTWLSGLSDEDFKTVCCGEHSDMEALMAAAPPFTDTLLTEYFEEVC